MFFAALLPQFVDRSGPAAASQMLILGLVFVLIALVLDSGWGLAAGSARRWLAERPKRRRRLDIASGSTMIGLCLLLAVSGRTD